MGHRGRAQESARLLGLTLGGVGRRSAAFPGLSFGTVHVLGAVVQTLYAREAVLTATSKLQVRGFLLRVETGWGPPRPETSLLGTQDGTRSKGAGAQGILAAVRTQIRGLTHLFRADQRAAHVRG